MKTPRAKSQESVAMSKLETPITRWYWQTLGGLLLEEFCLVNRTAACGGRRVHALVLPERETRIAERGQEIDIASGERAVLVQTKDSRLGMYLMGQTLFSATAVRFLSIRSACATRVAILVSV
jgi:hypothetical protein